MIRPIHVLCLTVSAFALLPGFTHAQNYVPSNAFSGPNVVIDFAALDQARGGQNQWAVAPAQVIEENLPMPAPAPKLTPPAAPHAMAMAPMVPTAQDSNPSFSMAAHDAGITPVAPAMPPRDDFSARDMLDAAPSAPVMAASDAPLPMATKSAAPFNADNGNIRTRAMLANARHDSKDQHGRVNLASITSTPSSAPAHDEEPIVTAAVAPAPIAKAPAIAASKPQPESRPAFSDNAPILPPQKTIPMPAERDLGSLGEDLPPPMMAKNDAKIVANKPMELASLPLPTSKPAHAAPSNAGKHFTLNFAKDSGNLDGSSKAELDKIAKALKQDETLRAQVRAYAAGSADNSGQARRLSLTRALAARTYVLDQNIPATRLDIRALGNGQGSIDKPTGGSLDKVEITLVK